MISLTLPLTKEALSTLKAGDIAEISGVLYSARDAAHKRLIDMISNGQMLPFDINSSTIYYVGPTPAKKGCVIGSAGPTTSGRMDMYTPQLLDMGLSAMIGKGERSDEVIQAIVRNRAVYFGAIGGAGALLSSCIVAQEIIAFEELGCEAIRKLTVKALPVTVIIDSRGNDLYKIGMQKYAIE